jgi:hypothetical protein
MRHENGNCLPSGGFCTAVNDPICEAMHNAYYMGKRAVADVVEVKHGKWVKQGYEGIMTYCSECLHRAPFNNHHELILSNYCPNCGVKMDGKGD